MHGDPECGAFPLGEDSSLPFSTPWKQVIRKKTNAYETLRFHGVYANETE
jgi:hypothetical protein